MRLLSPLPIALAGSSAILIACGTPDQSRWHRQSGNSPVVYVHTSSSGAKREAPSRIESKVSPTGMLAQVRVKIDYIPAGRYARSKRRKLDPRYITIHSTQNYSGDAYAHARALNRGALGVSWHFTVQEDVAIQHLPTNEQGKHADFDGPGNHHSIGIEMCEHRGNNLGATIDRTAKLAAYLMKKHGIPIRNVVPHYHWPRHGRKPANKNCPHFLLDNGRPGRKWAWFLRKVEHYHRMMQEGTLVSAPLYPSNTRSSP